MEITFAPFGFVDRERTGNGFAPRRALLPIARVGIKAELPERGNDARPVTPPLPRDVVRHLGETFASSSSAGYDGQEPITVGIGLR